MRRCFVLSLTLLAGCASGQASPASEPRPVIRRIAASDATADTVRLTAEEIRLVDGPCQTNDPMPNGGPRAGDVPPMPSALPLRPLPYIPNVCPVIAAPGRKAVSPVQPLRGPKRGSRLPQP